MGWGKKLGRGIADAMQQFGQGTLQRKSDGINPFDIDAEGKQIPKEGWEYLSPQETEINMYLKKMMAMEKMKNALDPLGDLKKQRLMAEIAKLNRGGGGGGGSNDDEPMPTLKDMYTTK